MAKRRSQREALDKLNLALKLVDEVGGMYEGWRPGRNASARKRDDGFTVQTGFDRGYEVADRQNREDAEHAEELDDDYEGRGNYDGFDAVGAWEKEQSEGESPHVESVRRRKARDEEEDEEEEERKAREEEDEEEDEEEEEERKARDEDDEEEDEERGPEEDPVVRKIEGKSRRKGREDEEEGKKSRKARHSLKCRCDKCLTRKAMAYEDEHRPGRKARKSEPVRKALSMADVMEYQRKSFEAFDRIRKALPAIRDALLEANTANGELADEVYELREDLKTFMAAPTRKSRVATAEDRPARRGTASADAELSRKQAYTILNKALEELPKNSLEAQELAQDIARLELGFAEQLSPHARSLLKNNR